MFLKIYCDRVELQPFGLVNLGNRLQVLHLMIGSSNTGKSSGINEGGKLQPVNKYLYSYLLACSLVYFVAAIIATCTRWHNWSNASGFLLMAFPKIMFLATFLLLLSFWLEKSFLKIFQAKSLMRCF